MRKAFKNLQDRCLGISASRCTRRESQGQQRIERALRCAKTIARHPSAAAEVAEAAAAAEEAEEVAAAEVEGGAWRAA